MSQQVIVDRDLEFRGAALYQPNVKGPMMTEYKIIDYVFDGTSTLYGWSSSVANGGTLAHAAVDGGAMTLTCGSTALDCAEFIHTAQWSPDKAVGVEIKAKISAITDVCVAVGLVDAYTNTNNRVALEMNGDVLTDCTGTADVAGMVFDTNATTDVWYCATVNAGSEATPVAALGTLIPVADTYFKIRIQTNTDGDVTYYYNGVAVGHAANAIADADTDLLAPYVGVISRSTGAVVCTVSRVTVWQEN